MIARSISKIKHSPPAILETNDLRACSKTIRFSPGRGILGGWMCSAAPHKTRVEQDCSAEKIAKTITRRTSWSIEKQQYGKQKSKKKKRLLLFGKIILRVTFRNLDYILYTFRRRRKIY